MCGSARNAARCPPRRRAPATRPAPPPDHAAANETPCAAQTSPPPPASGAAPGSERRGSWWWTWKRAIQERGEERAGQGFDKLSPNGCRQNNRHVVLPSPPRPQGRSERDELLGGRSTATGTYLKYVRMASTAQRRRSPAR